MTITNTVAMVLRLTLTNRLLGLLLLATVILFAGCGKYFKATGHYSGEIEEALEGVRAPAFYDVYVTQKGEDIFQLEYFFYDREAQSVVGIYKYVIPQLAERRFSPIP